MRSFFKTLVFLQLMALLALFAGFLWFVSSIPRDVPDVVEETDAIVVLTGGSHRVEVGFELLGRGLARKLFISGVGKGLNVQEVIRAVRQQTKTPDCCGDENVVVLGFEATDTVGNALETAQWVDREGYRSIRLVTANYHLPRAMREFSRAMPPRVMVLPYPVFPESVRIDGWWHSPGTFTLLASEYGKFLASALWHEAMP